MINVLFIDDEPDILEYYEMYFNDDKTIKGIYVSSAIAGLNKSIVADVNVIVTDLRMPTMSGQELIKRISTVLVDVPIIILSASVLAPTGIKYSKFLSKGSDIEILRKTILEVAK